MFYFIKTPGWLQGLYKNCVWKIPATEKILYLTFDDGPHPYVTPFVLDILKNYNAKATFFCIGKNVVEYYDVYKRIISEGHSVGNHTFNHLNGWKANTGLYMKNIEEANKCIESNLFRPPYGRITKSQIKLLTGEDIKLKPIMWTVLSGDFDVSVTKEKCLRNVIEKSESGDIVVFHDSEKAFQKLEFTLPKVLDYFIARGYRFEKLKQA